MITNNRQISMARDALVNEISIPNNFIGIIFFISNCANGDFMFTPFFFFHFQNRVPGAIRTRGLKIRVLRSIHELREQFQIILTYIRCFDKFSLVILKLVPYCVGNFFCNHFECFSISDFMPFIPIFGLFWLAMFGKFSHDFVSLHCNLSLGEPCCSFVLCYFKTTSEVICIKQCPMFFRLLISILNVCMLYPDVRSNIWKNLF